MQEKQTARFPGRWKWRASTAKLWTELCGGHHGHQPGEGIRKSASARCVEMTPAKTTKGAVPTFRGGPVADADHHSASLEVESGFAARGHAAGDDEHPHVVSQNTDCTKRYIDDV